jgi:hypothetical protein
VRAENPCVDPKAHPCPRHLRPSTFVYSSRGVAARKSQRPGQRTFGNAAFAASGKRPIPAAAPPQSLQCASQCTMHGGQGYGAGQAAVQAAQVGAATTSGQPGPSTRQAAAPGGPAQRPHSAAAGTAATGGHTYAPGDFKAPKVAAAGATSVSLCKSLRAAFRASPTASTRLLLSSSHEHATNHLRASLTEAARRPGCDGTPRTVSVGTQPLAAPSWHTHPEVRRQPLAGGE